MFTYHSINIFYVNRALPTGWIVSSGDAKSQTMWAFHQFYLDFSPYLPRVSRQKSFQVLRYCRYLFSR